MTAKHTPGPWRAVIAKTSLDAGGIYAGDSEMCNFFGREIGDIYLAAAAPELLDAAKRARAMFLAIASLPDEAGFDVSVFADVVKRLDSAIAKAEGEGA
jgi:hypothetical protein